MKYTRLSPDQQQQLIEQRLQQLEAEHFQHALNLERVVAALARPNLDEAIRAQLELELKATNEIMGRVDEAYDADTAALGKVPPHAPAGKP